MDNKFFIGIDIGTQGARVMLLDQNGEVVGEQKRDFLLDKHSREEQSPAVWWDTCIKIITQLLAEVKNKADIRAIKAMAVTSTSGTVIPLDKSGRPLHNALMYSDKRAAEVAPDCERAALRFFKEQPAYTKFNASSGLCKMVWFVKHFPEKAEQIDKWVHAADFITGKLGGRFGTSDETNALKSGYDIFSRSWPDYLYKELSLKKEWLPRVVSSGTPVGNLSASLAKKLGLPSGVKIVAGMTDGCASQVASGAVKTGDWNTTIGTTLVIKGVTRKPVWDPQGRLYNHRHPEGYFMPGGAGNTGADWVSMAFKEDLSDLTKAAEEIIPTGHISWPLQTEGERFPLIAPQARGFEPEGLSRRERFAANMEGVAYLEKYAYQMIEGLSGEKVHAVYTAGGGSESDVWLKIRSSVLHLPIYKMKWVSGAVGAAILAASQTGFSSLSSAAAALTQKEEIITPDNELANSYQKYYKRFVDALRERKYIE